MIVMTTRTLQILLSLAEGPRHGYGVKLDIEERTAGTVRIGAGTLYEAIQRLESCGWIREVAAPPDAESPAGPARRYYGLTAAGRTALRDELRRLEGIVRSARARAILSR
ncbi:MAG: helix-turn-helix transcriptional regulator [Gemmatimonadetes bacterium]|nr:helix-turn-helix transcriptional regulator [Gemmatimonadota bacterium]